jgi:hypothetical protein
MINRGGRARGDKSMIIPLNKIIKLILLYLHTIGFSIWFGSIVMGYQASEIVPVTVIGSGILLLARKIIKHGWEWLRCVKGCITLFKAAMLIIGSYFFSPLVLLSAAIMCGLLSTHLPKETKDIRLI